MDELSGGMTYEIALYPRHDQVRQAIDFGIGELPALGKMVPFGDAPAAARGGGMLRGKHRMPRHGVWRPSLRGFAAPMRARSSSRAWRSITALPFARAYARSFADNSNFARNEERESRFSVPSIHRRSAPSSASSGKTRSISPSIPHTSAQPTPAYISPIDQAAADWGRSRRPLLPATIRYCRARAGRPTTGNA